MASEPALRWRTVLLAIWIFGCAAYYYARFTTAFIHENDTAIRGALPRIADVFLSGRGDR